MVSCFCDVSGLGIRVMLPSCNDLGAIHSFCFLYQTADDWYYSLLTFWYNLPVKLCWVWSFLLFVGRF